MEPYFYLLFVNENLLSRIILFFYKKKKISLKYKELHLKEEFSTTCTIKISMFSSYFMTRAQSNFYYQSFFIKIFSSKDFQI